ncbi:phage holin family protein [Microbacterium sp.]|uniref:phage holin family protein n=1 Tax=Microbacterium sp. TaxID=51671 RepID=UPI0039E375B7
MIRFLIRLSISIASSALGLLVAALVVVGFRLELGGFLVAVIVFAIAQSVLTPFAFNLARKNATALLGGIGLISTLLALLIASLFPGGIRVTGVTAWIVGALVVWLVNALGGWLLAALFLKKRVVTKR